MEKRVIKELFIKCDKVNIRVNQRGEQDINDAIFSCIIKLFSCISYPCVIKFELKFSGK